MPLSVQTFRLLIHFVLCRNANRDGVIDRGDIVVDANRPGDSGNYVILTSFSTFGDVVGDLDKVGNKT